MGVSAREEAELQYCKTISATACEIAICEGKITRMHPTCATGEKYRTLIGRAGQALNYVAATAYCQDGNIFIPSFDLRLLRGSRRAIPILAESALTDGHRNNARS